jgi:hypothetical protein
VEIPVKASADFGFRVSANAEGALWQRMVMRSFYRGSD